MMRVFSIPSVPTLLPWISPKNGSMLLTSAVNALSAIRDYLGPIRD
jgi:hypothetical protein